MISGSVISGAVSPSLVRGTGLPSSLSPEVRSTKEPGQSDFSDLFRGTMGQVDDLEQRARTAVDGLIRGTGIDVHQALIAAEKANAAFELALAMRNKAIQSYQSVMSMQF